MTKDAIVKRFKSLWRSVDDEVKHDKVAKQQAWSDFTDALCKDGQITEHQYNTWSNPF